METTKKVVIAIAVLILVYVAGYGTGKYSSVKSKDNEVNVSDKQTTDTKDTTVTETKPDGTKIVTVVKENVVVKEKQVTVETKIEKVVRPDWKVTLGTGYDFREKKEVYSVGVDRRILGNISIGLYGVSNNTVGVNVGIEF